MSKEHCLLIAEDLPIPDLCNFLHSCHGLSHLLVPRLLELGLQGRGELTALQWAAKCSYESLVVQAILNGAQVDKNTKCRLKYTALHLAAMSVKPNRNIIETLVKHGDRIDSQNSELYTPLHLATKFMKPSPDIIETLVKHSARIDAKDSRFRTPLHVATVFGRERVVWVPLRLGAGTKEDGRQGLNKLVHLATVQGLGSCTQALVAASLEF